MPKLQQPDGAWLEELDRLMKAFGADEPEDLGPPIVPKNPGRGRPRKGPPLIEVPEYIKERGRLHGNLGEDLERETRRFREEDRREAISASNRRAHKRGDGKANLERTAEKRRRVLQIAHSNADLLSDFTRSISNVADEILERGTDCGLSERTLRSYISLLRKIKKAGKAK